MLDILHILKARHQYLEFVLNQGIIPGQLDSLEYKELIGRAKELRYLLKFIEDNGIE